MLKKITLVGLFVLTSAMALPIDGNSGKTTASLSSSTSTQSPRPQFNCQTPWFPWLCH